VILAAALLAWPVPEAAPNRTPAAQQDGGKAPDGLNTLNNVARGAYRRARAEALARTGPVILVEGDDLVLKYGIQRTEVRFTPAAYHTLKSVSHVPLGIYALLAFAGDGELDAPRLYDLKEFSAAVAAAPKALEGTALTPAQRERQVQLLREYQEFLDAVVKARRCDRKRLTAFLKAVYPLVEANADEAAALQIDALHRQVGALRAKLTEKEWDRVVVVVMGTQLPRKDNLAVQYFARLLGEPGEGKRVVYAEALFDEAKALDLLGTRILDTHVGEAFFSDPLRMHRDLLGDAARKHLDQVFKKQ
jgi:hypothetical protein